MRIASSQVAMSAQHAHTTVKSRSEKLESWVGARPSDGGQQAAAAAGAKAPPPIQAPARATRASGDAALSRTADNRNAIDLAILLRTLGASSEEVQQSLRQIETAQSTAQAQGITVEITVQAAGGQAQSATQGWGLSYDLQEETVETEATSFEAAGSVTTADGRAIELAVAQVQERVEARSTSIAIRAGDAKKVDPLVLNLANAPVAFEGSQTFDLDADGKAETIAKLDAGHAYLALDRNGNGIVDDGSELFGPATGDGFRELAAEDSDGNGWIDEADPVFAGLKLWSPASQEGGSLVGLADAGVGAIALQSVSTPFTMKSSGETQGYVSRTGIFLREDGEVGTIQHVDLVA
jgi:hypothetical protein